MRWGITHDHCSCLVEEVWGIACAAGGFSKVVGAWLRRGYCKVPWISRVFEVPGTPGHAGVSTAKYDNCSRVRVMPRYSSPLPNHPQNCHEDDQTLDRSISASKRLVHFFPVTATHHGTCGISNLKNRDMRTGNNFEKKI